MLDELLRAEVLEDGIDELELRRELDEKLLRTELDDRLDELGSRTLLLLLRVEELEDREKLLFLLDTLEPALLRELPPVDERLDPVDDETLPPCVQRQ